MLNDDSMICVDCNKKANLICEVCRRTVCEECVIENHKKNNFQNSEPNKIICAYCAEVYWNGY